MSTNFFNCLMNELFKWYKEQAPHGKIVKINQNKLSNIYFLILSLNDYIIENTTLTLTKTGIKEKKLKNYLRNNDFINDQVMDLPLPYDIIPSIESLALLDSINKLKHLNPDIILLSNYELTNIIKHWNCCREKFLLLTDENKSEPIVKEEVSTNSNNTYTIQK